jgi:hypothetical protein
MKRTLLDFHKTESLSYENKGRKKMKTAVRLMIILTVNIKTKHSGI